VLENFADPGAVLRAELARRGLGYVLAVAKTHPVTIAIGPPRPAAELAQRLPPRAWQRLSARPGAKGPRWHDWALVDVTGPAVTEGSGQHWLLIRRRISDGEHAFYLARAPHPVPLAQLVRVAGSRWKIADGFAAARLRVPGRPGRSPASRQRPGRQPDDPPDPVRDSQAPRQPAPAAARSRHATALVPVATPASGHCLPVPLPAPPGPCP
jgi:hypothetical protein